MEPRVYGDYNLDACEKLELFYETKKSGCIRLLQKGAAK